MKNILSQFCLSLFLVSIICFSGKLSFADEIQKVDINTATVEELSSIKGIGEKKAQSIVKYRYNNDQFESIEDLKNVKGIGDKLFDKIKDRIEVKQAAG